MVDRARYPEWLENLMFWIWDDAPEEDEEANHRLLKKLCEFREFHIVIDDHCGKPEHRYCLICETPQPNEPIE